MPSPCLDSPFSFPISFAQAAATIALQTEAKENTRLPRHSQLPKQPPPPLEEAIKPNRGTLVKGMEGGSIILKFFVLIFCTLKLLACENFHFETFSFNIFENISSCPHPLCRPPIGFAQDQPKAPAEEAKASEPEVAPPPLEEAIKPDRGTLEKAWNGGQYLQFRTREGP